MVILKRTAEDIRLELENGLNNRGGLNLPKQFALAKLEKWAASIAIHGFGHSDGTKDYRDDMSKTCARLIQNNLFQHALEFLKKR
jgi:hypothetical protein